MARGCVRDPRPRENHGAPFWPVRPLSTARCFGSVSSDDVGGDISRPMYVRSNPARGAPPALEEAIMPDSGDVRTPAIHGDDIVFVCEDDLWLVGASGARAARLPAGVAEAGTPRISPDGPLLAFTGREEGPAEVYAMPAGGGEARRLTYQGGRTIVAGFAPDGAIVYATDAGRPL